MQYKLIAINSSATLANILAVLSVDSNNETAWQGLITEFISLHLDSATNRAILKSWQPDLLAFLEGDLPALPKDHTALDRAKRSFYNVLSNLNTENSKAAASRLMRDYGFIIKGSTQAISPNLQVLESVEKLPDKQTLKQIALNTLSTKDISSSNFNIKETELIPPVPFSCYAPAFTPDGKFAVFQNIENNGKVWIYDSATKELYWKFTTPKDCIAPAFTPDSKFAVFQIDDDNGKVWVYDLATKKQYYNFTTPEDCYAPGFAPDSKFAVFQSGEDNGKVWIYDLAMKKRYCKFTNPENCDLPTFTPDGKFAVFQNEESKGKVWVYTTSTWKLLLGFNKYTLEELPLPRKK